MDNPEASSPTALRLQKTIRTYVSQHLQQNLLGLQSLPGEDELEKLQEQRRLEAQRRIEQERRAAAEREQHRREERLKDDDLEERRMSRQIPDFKTTKVKTEEVVANSGWKPTDVGVNLTSSDDPMIQQINIIRAYAKQAKQAQRWDEVQMLEQNLRDLQMEYWQQQKHQIIAETATDANQPQSFSQALSATTSPRKHVPSPSRQMPGPTQISTAGFPKDSFKNAQEHFAASNGATAATRSPVHQAKPTPSAPSERLADSNPFAADSTNPFSEDFDDDDDPNNPFSSAYNKS